MKNSIAALLLVFLIAFLLAFAVMPAFAGDLSYTFDPPTTRTDGKPLAPDEIKQYNGVIRQLSDQSESTFTVPGTDTGFTRSGLVAGDYCVKLSTTDTEGRTDGFSNEVCKTVPEGPLMPPSPPVLHGGVTVTADSEELVKEDGAAANAIDGDPDTKWHTAWHNDTYPHWLLIDMGEVKTISSVSYLPIQDNGNIKQYSIEVSTDGNNYSKVASGDFVNDMTKKTVIFAQVDAKYVKFNALSAQNGKAWAHAGEVTIQ